MSPLARWFNLCPQPRGIATLIGAMARPDPALALRVPSAARRTTRADRVEERPRLRLVVDAGRLAIELDAPCELGPLLIEELAVALPEVRFPVELSGGAKAFRNKRGRLERVTIRLSAAAAHRFAKPRLKGIVPGVLLHHMIAPTEDGWLVGAASDSAALAFEIVVAPLDGDLRLMIADARGVGLSAPPQALATRALYALLRPFGVSAGGAVVLEEPTGELARQLLPLAGMRAPAVSDMRFTTLSSDVDSTVLSAARAETPYAVGARAQRAVELAMLASTAEEALLAGATDRARAAYLEALTRAPRHPELARRLAALDASVGARVEAALATLSDAVPPLEAGPLGAELLSAAGDVRGSAVAWRRAATSEPYGPLAAHCWLEASKTIGDPVDAAEALDQAIARAPSLSGPRFQRLSLAMSLGQLERARAEIEHLEGQAPSAAARHRVLTRAAQMWLSHRALEEAAESYERALRYTPDSVDAVAGLARALKMMGHEERALELFGRGVMLAERAGVRAHRVRIDLAKALAEIADDRPAAGWRA